MTLNFGKMRVVKDLKKAQDMSRDGAKLWKMFDIPLFGRGSDEVLKLVEINGLRLGQKPYWIATVNTEFVMEACKDRDFLSLLQNKTSLNVVDAIGLIWAREVIGDDGMKASMLTKLWRGLRVGIEILQGKHKENLTPGVDLVDQMCGLAERLNKTVYFYGGWDDRAERTADFFKKRYPKLRVVGCQAENFDFTTEVDFLFVARAMKKQELWIEENREKLKAKVVIGVGRTFDHYSGALPRAPERIRRMGLEWLYALYQQPNRWKRQLALPKFIWKVLTV